MDKFDDIGKGEPCKTCWFGPVFPSCIKIVGDCGSHNKWHGYKPKGDADERDDTGDLIGDIIQDVWDAETDPELARSWIAKRLAARRPSAEPGALREALAQRAKTEQAHCYFEPADSEINDLMQTRHDLRKCGDIARAALDAGKE